MDKDKALSDWLENLPEEGPDEIDIVTMKQAKEENDGSAISLEDFRDKVDAPILSGRVNARMPRSLHKRLIEDAKREGVSLIQHIVVSLAKTVYSQDRK